MTDEQCTRSLEIHRQLKRAQARRYRNRFTLRDGDYHDQAELRELAEAAMKRALIGG